MRLIKRIAIYEYDSYVPLNLIDFIKMCKAKIAEIPREFVNDANIQINCTSGYEGDCFPKILIDYPRPETDDEMNARIDEQFAIEKENNIRERDWYEYLKKKYEGDGL